MNAASPAVAAESCDFCHAALGEQHQHLLDPWTRRLECVCDPCAILFGGRGETKRRRVPRRVRYLPGFRLNDLHWNALSIPIGLAFIFRSSAAEKVVAIYPSPGGPIESEIPLDSWGEINRENPVLESMESDVEALLIYRVHDSRDYFLAPIDECFKLVGLIRTRWTGFSGGTVLWQEVERFVERLKR